ncbi:MAG TPA: DUF983 domain-containing protein [Methylomirabilota bacterium]|jgi:uncharacterized protein (DUF983 family)
MTRVLPAMRRAVTLRCPRCGATPLFPGPKWFTMTPACALCGLRFERAPGYFVGAIYVNYAVTTVIAVVGYLVLWARADLSTPAQLAIWIPFCVLFPLWFFRYSRSLWLALEYLVNPEP